MGSVKNYYFDDNELGNLPPEAFGPFPSDGPFDPDDNWLETAEKDDQLTAMREWFFANYRAPEDETPYNGREGGFLFINGGPYDPADVLPERFTGVVSDAIIEEVVNEMHDQGGHEWAPIHYAPPDEYDYDVRFSLQLQSRDEPLSRLKDRLQQAQRVLTLEGEFTAKILAQQLTFSAAIAALEAFLWETVDYWAERDPKALRAIVTQIPAIRDEKIVLGDIFDQFEGLKERVKGYLQNLVWHRWALVSPLLRKGLGINHPSFKQFEDALVKRHDIVHRSGHDKAGRPIIVSIQEIHDLCKNIEAFAIAIDGSLAQRKDPSDDSSLF
ncbi:hypothetical protein [Collimonas fungivorans]|uniref:hypothetical protein n=1 Tax=Collimonas fungivorans TaxID=158899 RepID=UPI003FA3687C